MMNLLRLLCICSWSLLLQQHSVHTTASKLPIDTVNQIKSFDWKGGAAVVEGSESDSPYRRLALVLQSRLDGSYSIDEIEKSLKSLSAAQKALKGLDGAAHEAYQRTRSSKSKELTSVSGRAKRSAARAASTAEGLFSGELCEFLHEPELGEDEDGPLKFREIVCQVTQVPLTKQHNVSVIVLWESHYSGGVGLQHGSIEDMVDRAPEEERGRLLIIIKDDLEIEEIEKALDILDEEPLEIELKAGLVANEIASVQNTLYKTAGRVLKKIGKLLMTDDRWSDRADIAIHFVGRSLGGGVAGLAATILDGTLPLPNTRLQRRRKDIETGDSNSTTPQLEGFGRGRSSAMLLGPPPCLSANVKAAFVKSIIYGDDVICRTTQESLERLCQRTQRGLKGGVLGRRIGWMTDTFALTVSSLQSHAKGSEGEEARLCVPGQSFLVRPRRLGGACSMHELGDRKGGREALRASVLWQLHDLLLSKSMWKHHTLDSYIHGLDRVQLRGFED